MRKVYLTVFVALLACLVCTTPGMAQTTPETIDVLWTNDDRKWIGHIVEWNTETGLVRFETRSGLEITLEIADVHKVRQKLMKPEGQRAAKTYAFPEEGVYQTVELGVSAGPEAGISGTYALGYRFSRAFSTGAGVGFENFELWEGKRVIPVFVEGRGFLSRAVISPYYAMRVGYGIALKNSSYDISDARGGVMFNPQMGVRFGAGEHLNVYGGFGVHIQRATFVYDWGSESRFTDKFWYRRAEVKFGMIF